ncbi:MAG: LytTR family transcriptional regulator [Balneolaceae bacterium]|nr:LytTR family transcriptional regulator [Balneolaceae bacterium]MCH8549828.1 LytTR family transcriptional regulator [Balneolaceae bacterium]
MNKVMPLTLNDKILLDGGKKCELVDLKDVRYFETCGNYSKTYYSGGIMLINRTLSYLNDKLPERIFFRANRQYIVNLTHIKNVQLTNHAMFQIEMSCGKEIEISRRRSQEFRDILTL